MSPDLFTRDGRLTDLTLDRYLVGDLSPEESAAVAEHLAAHPEEQARQRAAREEIAAPLPPLRLPTAAPPKPPQEAPMAEVIPLFSARRAWVALGGALAVAAALLVFVQPPSSTDPSGEFTARGSSRLDLRVVVQDGRSGDHHAIRAGDRLMFQVTPRQEGHLLVLGVDGAGSVYPWHPSGEGAASVPVAVGAAVQPAVGIQVDATPGAERIVALLCDAPVRYTEVRGALASAAALAGEAGALPAVRQGCEQSVAVLQKEVP